jgi:hypothetical protein
LNDFSVYFLEKKFPLTLATSSEEEGTGRRRRQNKPTEETQEDNNKSRCHRLIQDGQYGRATHDFTSLGIDQSSSAAYDIMEKHP